MSDTLILFAIIFFSISGAFNIAMNAEVIAGLNFALAILNSYILLRRIRIYKGEHKSE